MSAILIPSSPPTRSGTIGTPMEIEVNPISKKSHHEHIVATSVKMIIAEYRLNTDYFPK
jgi:hypothetical protein